MKYILTAMSLSVSSMAFSEASISSSDNEVLLRASNSSSPIKELRLFVDESEKLALELLEFDENCEICKQKDVANLYLFEFNPMPYIHSVGLTATFELNYGESLGFPIPTGAERFQQHCAITNWKSGDWRIERDEAGELIRFSRIEAAKQFPLELSCQYQYVFPYGGVYTGFPVEGVGQRITTRLIPVN